jgi:hypothetical protein
LPAIANTPTTLGRKSSRKLLEALREAPQRGWTVVNMKADWNVIFASVSK